MSRVELEDADERGRRGTEGIGGGLESLVLVRKDLAEEVTLKAKS